MNFPRLAISDCDPNERHLEHSLRRISALPVLSLDETLLGGVGYPTSRTHSKLTAAGLPPSSSRHDHCTARLSHLPSRCASVDYSIPIAAVIVLAEVCSLILTYDTAQLKAFTGQTGNARISVSVKCNLLMSLTQPSPDTFVRQGAFSSEHSFDHLASIEDGRGHRYSPGAHNQACTVRSRWPDLATHANVSLSVSIPHNAYLPGLADADTPHCMPCHRKLYRLMFIAAQSGLAPLLVSLPALVIFFRLPMTNISFGMAFCIGRLYTLTLLLNLTLRSSASTPTANAASSRSGGVMTNASTSKPIGLHTFFVEPSRARYTRNQSRSGRGNVTVLAEAEPPADTDIERSAFPYERETIVDLGEEVSPVAC